MSAVDFLNKLLAQRARILAVPFLAFLLFPIWKENPLSVEGTLWENHTFGFLFSRPGHGAEIAHEYYFIVGAFLFGLYCLLPNQLPDSATQWVEKTFGLRSTP